MKNVGLFTFLVAVQCPETTNQTFFALSIHTTWQRMLNHPASVAPGPFTHLVEAKIGVLESAKVSPLAN